MFSLQIFINNEFVNSVSGRTFGTFDPCTKEKICDIQEGDKVGACVLGILQIKAPAKGQCQVKILRPEWIYKFTNRLATFFFSMLKISFGLVGDFFLETGPRFCMI